MVTTFAKYECYTFTQQLCFFKNWLSSNYLLPNWTYSLPWRNITMCSYVVCILRKKLLQSWRNSLNFLFSVDWMSWNILTIWIYICVHHFVCLHVCTCILAHKSMYSHSPGIFEQLSVCRYREKAVQSDNVKLTTTY